MGKQDDDTVMNPELTRPGDIVILVMGPTGAGKSTFINNLLPDHTAQAAVSDGFYPCTTILSPYFVEIPLETAKKHPGVSGRRLVLVDTPGFDETSSDDSEILGRIAIWLASSYSAVMKVSGLVYLFPIYPNRITRTECSNLKAFQKTCGKNGLSKIVLGTTRWDICPPNSGESRELKLRNNFWANIIDPSTGGSSAPMIRLGDNPGSAWELIDLILGHLVDFTDDNAIPAMGPPVSGTSMKLNELSEQTNPRSAGRKKPSIMSNLMQPGDTCMPLNLVRKDDIIIPVMGPTGVGKSTFINNLLPSPIADARAGFDSCTSQVAHYFVNIPPKLAEEYDVEGRRLILVDTPSFEHTNLSDREVLRRIAVWLASSYDANMKVGGVVYMFPIYPCRMTREDQTYMKVFQKLCGKRNLSKVVLATTQWDVCPEDSGKAREDELRTCFWVDMLNKVDQGEGAQMARLTDETGSAWSIISLILGRLRDEESEGVVLDIQRQLVDKKKTFPETAAAQELPQKLKELLSPENIEPRKQRIHALVPQAKEQQVPITQRILSAFGL